MTKPMTSDSEEQCVFCKRIKNEEYDDRFANHVMFEPLNPVTDGHRLVVPVPHTPHLNTGELEAGQTGWALRYFTNDLDQYNIITSKGSDATQTIQHLHFHIVPRTKDDGLKLPWSGQHTDDHANTEPLRKLAQEAQSEAPSVDTTSLEQKITKLTLEIASKQKVISRLKAGTNVCQDCGRILTRCENCERLWQT